MSKNYHNSLAYETDILEYWNKINVSDLIQKNDSIQEKKVFNFVDGPPFVSGSLHMGSLSVSFIKDTVLRYQRMQGKRCTNKIGFDCHGLPSENMVMKILNLKCKKDIEEYGVKNFIEKCISLINDCSDSWKPTYDRIGRTVDFNNQYKTIDTNFMESVWWIFKQIFNKGLVYKAYKVMPYSYACETPLSNFEAGSNYKKINTNTVYVKFELKNTPKTFFVIWTTTPWTLPSNVCLVVNANIMYVKCHLDNGDIYIVSKSCVGNLKKDFVKVEDYCLGSQLKGIEYIPLFNYMNFKFHKVLVDSYVQDTSEIGTGIVHISPAHGLDDSRICLENNVLKSQDLDKTCLVDSTGKFVKGTGELEGQLVFDTNKTITFMLKQKDALVAQENYHHSYPHCYRSDTKLIYKIVHSHFIEVSKIRDQLLDLNSKINWSNPDIGNKRFHNWLADANDWCISRNRYFGTPIPIWESEDGTEKVVVGSIDELMKLANLSEPPKDLHLSNVKDIVITSDTGKKLFLSGECADCWLESGSVLYAQNHYPFENGNMYDNKGYLCDFVAEGIDQTRGWFYTMLVISAIISNKPPFRNVICTGLILDDNRQKLSKSNGNFVNPDILIKKYGADTTRLYILGSQLVNGEELIFNEKEIDVLRNKIISLMNAVEFYQERTRVIKTEGKHVVVTYPNIDTQDVMDTWILSKLDILKDKVTHFMNLFSLTKATTLLLDFIEDLCNWYIKISRDRLKGNEGTEEQEKSLSVLFTVLFDYTLVLAPFAPFLTEHIYKLLVKDYLSSTTLQSSFDILQFNKSVHLCLFPNGARGVWSNEFDELKKVVEALREVRAKSKTHKALRTPIKKCTFYSDNREYLDGLKNIINVVYEEVNCLEFEYQLIREDMFVYKAKINERSLGMKYRRNASQIKQQIEALSQKELKKLHLENKLDLGNVILTDEDLDVTLESREPNTVTLSSGVIMQVDLTYDDQVQKFSHIKNIVFKIQRCRKMLGLKPWDDIIVEYTTQCEFLDQFEKHITFKIQKPFVKSEIPLTEEDASTVYISPSDDEEKTEYKQVKVLIKIQRKN
jgi:isoleucyl-tRNA synthetase